MRKIFSKQVREEAAALYLKGGKSLTEISRAYGITGSSTLRKWVTAYEKSAKVGLLPTFSATKAMDHEALLSEVIKLREEKVVYEAMLEAVKRIHGLDVKKKFIKGRR